MINLKNKKIFFVPAIVFLFVFSLIITLFSPVSFSNIAKALSGNYSKSSGSSLDFSDWNNLVNDFLDKESLTGDSMAGPLTLPADPTTNMQAATKQYVDTAIVSGTGGGIYTNWGQEVCPIGSLIYSGFAFSQKWDEEYGSNEVLCIKSGDPGAGSTNQVDRLSPVSTGQLGYIPPGITDESIVKCALCSVPQSACFIEYGSDTCNPAAGFNPAYTGYVMGGSEGTYYAATNKNQIERKCVNTSFDGSIPRGSWGAIFYGSVLYNNYGLSGSFPASDDYIKCAVCCN